jgi:ribosomal protein S14
MELGPGKGAPKAFLFVSFNVTRHIFQKTAHKIEILGFAIF